MVRAFVCPRKFRDLDTKTRSEVTVTFVRTPFTLELDKEIVDCIISFAKDDCVVNVEHKNAMLANEQTRIKN